MKKTVSLKLTQCWFAVARCLFSDSSAFGIGGADHELLLLSRSRHFPSSEEFANDVMNRGNNVYGKEHFNDLSDNIKKIITSDYPTPEDSDSSLYKGSSVQETLDDHLEDQRFGLDANGHIQLEKSSIGADNPHPSTPTFSTSSAEASPSSDAHVESENSQQVPKGFEHEICMDPTAPSDSADLNNQSNVSVVNDILEEKTSSYSAIENASSMQISSSKPAEVSNPVISDLNPKSNNLSQNGGKSFANNAIETAILANSSSAPSLLHASEVCPNPNSADGFKHLVNLQSHVGGESLAMVREPSSDMTAGVFLDVPNLYENARNLAQQTQQLIAELVSYFVNSVVSYVGYTHSSVKAGFSYVQSVADENAVLKAIGFNLALHFIRLVMGLIEECITFVFKCLSLVLQTLKNLISSLISLILNNILVTMLILTGFITVAIITISITIFLGYNTKLANWFRKRANKIATNDTSKRRIIENAKSKQFVDKHGLHKAGTASQYVINVGKQSNSNSSKSNTKSIPEQPSYEIPKVSTQVDEEDSSHIAPKQDLQSQLTGEHVEVVDAKTYSESAIKPTATDGETNDQSAVKEPIYDHENDMEEFNPKLAVIPGLVEAGI
ncbi:uncharacterized protein VICG_01152 [Vittaforma corneae ATCC 50505]|uniref:Uncharacterized protein n=1 Tax=Vittaforma corneae (strain ATCC 50505) TaxID=993615 RepID=L2GMR7_VITCO|nr:uncharacterized protein VICG_01152 [Vittaforma corneae ATCC 50505]ELA41800.1 hypothetical protein VICG_01152 [Vittaforma corneae ATCC 50505]